MEVKKEIRVSTNVDVDISMNIKHIRKLKQKFTHTEIL